MSIFQRDLNKLFNPKSVAIVGASNLPGKWGFMMPMNVIGGGYRGRIFMVNPREKMILGFPSYPSIKDIEEEIDLLVVAIPASKVLPVIEEAVEKGIKNAVVVSSNFSEAGEEGAKLERRLSDVATAGELTIVGPNTMGIYSASSDLSCMGAPVYPLKGNVGFISQSGNLGIQLMAWGQRRGIGFSRFVGSGNAANTNIVDFLEYLGDDPITETIILYIEGLKDGRRFLDAACHITPRKPVIALKAGKGGKGQSAVLSHTGSLAGEFKLFQAMMEQTGIIEAETTEELVDLAAAFSALPVPSGNRVAVMTLGGGWGVAAADAFDKEGLEMVELPQSVIEELDNTLPSFWSRKNPVDIVGNVNRANHFKVLDALASADNVDMVISMGTLLGRNFWLDNMLKTTLKPWGNMIRYHTKRLVFFQHSILMGFLRAMKRSTESHPEGSGGINPNEALQWRDSVFVAHLKELVRTKKKTIITVAVNEGERSASALMRDSDLFTASTPERAVRVAGKLATYSRFLNGHKNKVSN
jgi:acyl-CoA synthetase (NDP forming)